MIEFHQTRMGRTYYENHVPSLIKELGELNKQLAELNKPKENKVEILVNEWQLGHTIRGYAKNGWTLKHYIPQHLSLDDEQLVPTVLVFEK
jgi:hypothetical protein